MGTSLWNRAAAVVWPRCCGAVAVVPAALALDRGHESDIQKPWAGKARREIVP
ncbi:MAG: hypothetical protein FWG75_08525 [Cystobacterineae bacterium]|nr:hypothetical protein [Cystobacterineae bacterium]